MGPGMTKKDLLQEAFGDLEGDGAGGLIHAQHKVCVKREEPYSVGGINVHAEVAGDIFVANYEAHGSSGGGQNCPTGEVGVFRDLEVIGENIGTGEFVGVLKGMDTGKVHQGTVHAAAHKAFKIKWNRQSIHIDEYRFLKVDILRVDVKETDEQFSVCPVGFEDLCNLLHYSAGASTGSAS